MKTLNEHLKTKTFKNVYLLYGDEAYLRNQYRDKLKKAMINEGDTMNFSCFEGKGIDEKELTAMADTVPFFSDYRLIIVENSGFFKTSGHETLAEYMKHIPETTCIVFVESEVDKRSKLFKAVSSTGYAANLTMPGDKQLMLWLGGIVKRENKLIQEQTMQYFLQLVEHDMNGMRKFDILNALGQEDPVTVIRSGKACQIPCSQVVVGDIVVLQQGDEVPADLPSLYKETAEGGLALLQ